MLSEQTLNIAQACLHYGESWRNHRLRISIINTFSKIKNLSFYCRPAWNWTKRFNRTREDKGKGCLKLTITHSSKYTENFQNKVSSITDCIVSFITYPGPQTRTGGLQRPSCPQQTWSCLFSIKQECDSHFLQYLVQYKSSP